MLSFIHKSVKDSSLKSNISTPTQNLDEPQNDVYLPILLLVLPSESFPKGPWRAQGLENHGPALVCHDSPSLGIPFA